MQSIWISLRGVQKEMDEAKLRFAAAEVQFFWSTHVLLTQQKLIKPRMTLIWLMLLY